MGDADLVINSKTQLEHSFVWDPTCRGTLLALRYILTQFPAKAGPTSDRASSEFCACPARCCTGLTSIAQKLRSYKSR